MKLVRGEFKRWLEAKPAQEIVGKQRDSCACPLAQFYHDASGGYEVAIFDNGGEHMMDRGYSKRPLPEWASCFVFLVDGQTANVVTAERALALLAQITP